VWRKQLSQTHRTSSPGNDAHDLGMPLPLNTLPCNLVTGSVLIVVAVAAVVSARIRVESRSSQTSKQIITSALSISHAQTIVPDRVAKSRHSLPR